MLGGQSFQKLDRLLFAEKTPKMSAPQVCSEARAEWRCGQRRFANGYVSGHRLAENDDAMRLRTHSRASQVRLATETEMLLLTLPLRGA